MNLKILCESTHYSNQVAHYMPTLIPALEQRFEPLELYQSFVAVPAENVSYCTDKTFIFDIFCKVFNFFESKISKKWSFWNLSHFFEKLVPIPVGTSFFIMEI